MLILTRKVGESIKIGDDIRVIVLEVKGSQVRLGVDAPREKAIYREEIYERIQQEMLEAAEAGPESLGQALSLWKRLKGEEKG